VGSGQHEIRAFEADEREAYDEPRGAKENCGCAGKRWARVKATGFYHQIEQDRVTGK
jgi:hypothetical protein